MTELQAPTNGFNEVYVHTSGKRIGVGWTPWMEDWFCSVSPRNGNNNAEGPWEHWVDLALRILADPMTRIVKPAVFDKEYRGGDLYDETNRQLTIEELHERFPTDVKWETVDDEPGEDPT